MNVRPPTTDYLTVVEDSRRWQSVSLRDDDIVIVTPPKCGTTWMQGIVASLLWPNGDAPANRPWVDMRLEPLDELLSTLDAIEHRRFIKSHCPLSALPIGSDIRYVLVYRDPADALVSWGNHREKMLPIVMQAANTVGADDGLPALPERFDGDYDVLFDEWSTYWSPPRHLASSWEFRNEPNVAFFHYADLYRDLAGEMRRVADFLGLRVDETTFADQVQRCRIDAMRDQRRGAGVDSFFEGGADSFFYRGGNGRGRSLLTDEQIERVERHTNELLGPAAARWVTAGGDVPS